MCLTLGVTILDPTTETQLVLYSQCTVAAPVWSARLIFIDSLLHASNFYISGVRGYSCLNM